MSASAAQADPERPVVAVICRVSILCEVLSEALEDVATVRSFPASKGDTDGLLRMLRPDGVVVDSREEAAQAVDYARESGSPLVHIDMQERQLRVLRDDHWEAPDDAAASAEGVRNILVGGIFNKGRTS